MDKERNYNKLYEMRRNKIKDLTSLVNIVNILMYIYILILIKELIFSFKIRRITYQTMTPSIL